MVNTELAAAIRQEQTLHGPFAGFTDFVHRLVPYGATTGDVRVLLFDNYFDHISTVPWAILKERLDRVVGLERIAWWKSQNENIPFRPVFADDQELMIAGGAK